MKTIEEVLAKFEDGSSDDIFGTRRSDLMEFLPFELLVGKYLKPEATAAEWAAAGYPRPLTRETVIGLIKGYMPFAWDKANNCRGLSAARSLLHMQAWLWLLGADEAAMAIDNYTHYGKPQLRSICEALDIDWRSLDDGKWKEYEDREGADPFEGPPLTIPAGEAVP